MKWPAVVFALLVGCTGEIEDNGWPPSYDPPDVKLDPACEQYKFVPSALYPTDFPVNIILDGRLSSRNRGLMLDAIDSWNNRMGMEVVYATVTDNLQMHGKCNYAVVTDTTDLDAKWIGLTTYGQCAADIVNVETMATKMTDRGPEYYTDDLVLNVTVHEIGHVLGLPHEADHNSVMYESVGPGDKRYISERSYCLVQQAVIHTQ